MKKFLKWSGIVLAVLFVGIQFVPINRTNAPITREVKWDTPATRVLAQRACFDCHSNETVRPWYDRIAPVSFYVENHINDGKRRLNFSEWDKPNSDMGEIKKVLQNGSMPLWDYLIMHPNAKLSDQETTDLLAGLQATLKQDPPIRDKQGGGGDAG